MQYKISYWCSSHIGRVRSMNQDNYICDGRFMKINENNIESSFSGSTLSRRKAVFGVFDGLGGESCGEIASYIAANNASVLEIGKDAVLDLSLFCQKTNTDICSYATDHGITSMGTTAAVLAFTKNEVVLCNIGDSRIFRFRDGEIKQISEDHVGIAAYGAKPPLLQNLGIPPTELIINPYLAKGSYKNNDIYLVCSDGLTEMVAVKEIAEVLKSRPVYEAMGELMNSALMRGAYDNISMILCKVERAPCCYFNWMHRA